MAEPIKIQGLAEFNRNLRKLDSDLPKALRLAMNQAADVVIGYARPRVPRRSGKAAGSIKPQSTRTAVRVSAGGRKAPYYPWLDFGGRIGKRKSVKRAFLKEGRYLYAGYYKARDSGELVDIMREALLDVARQAGVEVT